MFNEATARAVLAERARERDSALHLHGLLHRTHQRRSTPGRLARFLERRQSSGPRAGTPAPAPIVAIDMRDGRSTPPTELRAS